MNDQPVIAQEASPSLRVKIQSGLYAAVPLLLGLLLGIVAFAGHEYFESIAESQSHATEVADELANKLNDSLKASDQFLRHLQAEVKLGRPLSSEHLAYDQAAMLDLLEYHDGVAVYDAEGRRVEESKEGVYKPSVAGDPLFDRQVDGDGVIEFGPVVWEPVEVKGRLPFSRRLVDAQGNFAGVAVALIDIDGFARHQTSLTQIDDPPFGLLNPDLSLAILVPDAAAISLGAAASPEQLRPVLARAPVGTGPYPGGSGDGGKWFAYHRVGTTPLYALSILSRSMMLKHWREEALPMIGWLLAGWFVLAAGVGLGLRAMIIRAASLRRACEGTPRPADPPIAWMLPIPELQPREASLEETIQELRAAVREKEMLFRELNHRVKNNLQLIASLLSLQANRTTDIEARHSLEVSLDRVHSIGLVHELLYQRDQTDQIDVPAYLKALCQRITTAYLPSDRLVCEIDADPIVMPLDVIIRLALIVNEIVTNAVKHAFPDGRRGHITVLFRRSENGCRLMIADDGVGMGQQPSKSDGRLGLELVELLARYFDGTFSTETGDFGTVFTLGIKLPSVA